MLKTKFWHVGGRLGDESGTFGAKMAKAKVAEAYMSKASEVREITNARMRVGNTE